MLDSKMLRFTVPGAVDEDGETNGARTIAMAAKVPLRVLVRNYSEGVTVYLSHEAQDVQTVPPGSGVFVLPPGERDVFVLAPRQKLFCISEDIDASITIAISEALPIDFKE